MPNHRFETPVLDTDFDDNGQSDYPSNVSRAVSDCYDDRPEYLAGCRAYWRGNPLACNPYPDDSVQGIIWALGWNDAQEAD